MNLSPYSYKGNYVIEPSVGKKLGFSRKERGQLKSPVFSLFP